MAGLTEKEAELLRFNEELDARREKAITNAEAVVKEQEMRLKSLLAAAPRSPSRAFASSDHGTPRRSTSSLRESFFSDNENEENLSTQSALTKDESLEDYEPNSMKSETPSGIGQEATIRYLRAQLRALQEDLSKSVSERKSLEEELAKSRKKLQSIEEDQKKTKRTANATDKELDKSKKVANSAQERIKRLEAELSQARQELEIIKRAQKAADSDAGSKEIRLNRALEEVEKYKSIVQELRSQAKEGNDISRQHYERLISDNKRLERQKQELTNAFRKQMRLIDILKRQKMHMEAARLLSFTEEEFTRILDSNLC